MKHFFTLLLIVFIALAFWGLQTYEKDVTIVEETDPHFIDLYLNDFMLTAMDADGKPNYTLQAVHLEHYKDDNFSTIVNPVIRLIKASSPWIISAQKGIIDDEQNRIILSDDVVMKQQEKDFPVQLNTSFMEIDTAGQIAQTDQTVYIFQQEFSIQSDGMVLDSATGKLELLDEVEGSYVQAN